MPWANGGARRMSFSASSSQSSGSSSYSSNNGISNGLASAAPTISRLVGISRRRLSVLEPNVGAPLHGVPPSVR